MFNPIVEHKSPVGISTKEAKTVMEIHPVTQKSKLRKCSVSFTVKQNFFF